MDERLKQFFRRAAWGVALALLFVWLAQRQPEHDQVVIEEFLGLGTLINVSVYLESGQTEDQFDAAMHDIRPMIAAYQQRWSVITDGGLSAVNQALAKGEAARIDAELHPLFARAAALSTASRGLFDVRVGGLVDLWGWNRQEAFGTQPPDDEAIAATLAAIAAAPALDAAHYGPAPGVQLNFGGIAKGDAAGKIGASLRAAGFEHYLVNMGGDVVARGRKGDGPWRIGVRHPRPPRAEQPLMGIVTTRGDETIFTSGDYERYFEFEGQRYHHLIDPRSGRPARGLTSATVITSDPVLADAASTALFVAGPDGWRDTARAMGIDQAMVMGADGRVQATQAFADRFQASTGVAVTVLP